MGDWLARIRFPDGREIYAVDSSNCSMVLDGLYESYRPASEPDSGGYLRGRNYIPYESPRLPHHPELALSEPDELIAVSVTTEDTMRSWTALFCPRRNELVGPRHAFVGDAVQRNFDLVRQNGKLHLKPGRSAHTLCGEEAVGEELPFMYFSGFGIVIPDPPPPKRNLFEEWNGGEVCRRCLLQALLTYEEWN